MHCLEQFMLKFHKPLNVLMWLRLCVQDTDKSIKLKLNESNN